MAELSHGEDAVPDNLPKNDINLATDANFTAEKLIKLNLFKEAESFRAIFVDALNNVRSLDQQWSRRLTWGWGAVPLSKIYKVSNIYWGPAGLRQRYDSNREYCNRDSVPITPRFDIRYVAMYGYEPHNQEAHAVHHRGRNYINNCLTVEIMEDGLRVMLIDSSEQEKLSDSSALISYLTTFMPHDGLTEEAHYRWDCRYGKLESKLKSSEPFEGQFIWTSNSIDILSTIKNAKHLLNEINSRDDLKFSLRGEDGESIGWPFKVKFQKQEDNRIVLQKIEIPTGLGTDFSKMVEMAAQKELKRLQVKVE